MKILIIGDVVGSRAVEYLKNKLRHVKDALGGIDFTVANGENASEIHGISAADAKEILDAGVDLITLGNHTYGRKDICTLLSDEQNIIRPANYHPSCPGIGYTIVDCGFRRILVMNVLGVTYMEPLACPFETVEAILEKEKGNYNISLLDVHAEATSEKAALAHYFDGKVTAVFGTHTHVQTNDAKVLPHGTGFITDLGMCGPENSILGVRSDIIIDKLRFHLPKKFEYATGGVKAHGAIFTIENGKCLCAETVSF